MTPPPTAQRTSDSASPLQKMPPPSEPGAPEPMDIDADVDSSEYETDTDAEPEEFYLSLDLTIPTPIHAGPSSNPHVNSAPPSHLPPPRPLSSTTRSGRSGRRSLPKHAPAPPPRRASSPTPSSADEQQQQQQTNPVERWAAGDHARIQILDLHTPNPLVSFGNRIWSGSWTATVGTEIFVRCPKGPAPEDDPALPHAAGAYVSQKDMSAAAAAGAQVDDAAVPGEEADPAAGEVIATAGVRVHCLPAVLAVKQRGLAATYANERTYGWRPTGKSSFLERLEEIRVAKGEKRPAGEREEGSTEEGTAGVESETDGERAVVPAPVGMGTAFQNRVDGAEQPEKNRPAGEKENQAGTGTGRGKGKAA